MLHPWDCFFQPLSHGSTSEEFLGELLICIASTAGLLNIVLTTTYNLFEKAEPLKSQETQKWLKIMISNQNCIRYDFSVSLLRLFQLFMKRNLFSKNRRL